MIARCFGKFSRAVTGAWNPAQSFLTRLLKALDELVDPRSLARREWGGSRRQGLGGIVV
ncbi:hypothetical protein SAMN05444170_5366 [Bradyrhizobium erythrophlei]|jgi:hypothetical protein|uniref:Uncharacterized protein n=1 Tax=Bradyrhizobium erythrophlei TaxID=1437360 RepID=A0A1M7UJC9_9BRAD|nr:hypothetical protein SAMN05444170_5366 [Bradyrhizobium erythrophlei]